MTVDTADPAVFDPATIRPTFLVVLVGIALASANQTIVSTALPTIVGEFGGYGELSWVVSSYLLSSAMVMPFAGKFSDLFGTAQVFRGSIAVFAVGSLVAGLSTSMTMLIGARLVQGIGGGAIMTVAFTLVGRLVPARERGRYQSKVASVLAATSLAGPLLGGFFVDHLTWRWAFGVVTALSVLALVMVQRLPDDEQPSGATVDYVGSLVIVVAVVSVMLVAMWGGQRYSWTSPIVLTLGCTSIIGFVIFVQWERRVREPLVPVRLLRRRAVWTAAALGFLMGIAMFGVVVYAPTYLQVTLGATATQSGLLLVPLMGCVLIGSDIGGRIMSATGRYQPVALAGSVLMAVGTGLLTTLGVGTAMAVPSIYVGIVGLGIGATMPVVVVAAQNAVDAGQLGAVTSIAQFARKIGSTLGVATLGGLFSAVLANTLDRHASRLPPGTDPDSLIESPAAIAALAPELASIVRSAVANSATASFKVAFVVTLVGVLVALRMPNDELGATPVRYNSAH